MSTRGKREVARRFERLKALKCYEAVVQMILAGFPLMGVVQFIQEHKGEYTDVKPSSLFTMLSDFRATLPTGESVSAFDPQRVIALQREFSDQEQDLRDITWAIDMLKENLQAAYQIVAETGYPSKGLQVDLDTLSRMIMRRHEIRMDLGLGGKTRQLGTLTVAPALMRRVHDKHGMVFDEIIGNPEKLSQVVSGATRLLEAASQRTDGVIIEAEVADGE